MSLLARVPARCEPVHRASVRWRPLPTAGGHNPCSRGHRIL